MDRCNEVAGKIEKKRRVRIGGILIPILIGLLTWIILHMFILILYVPTSSMSPYIEPGSLCIGSRVAYAFKTPQRGDVIVFTTSESDVKLVKRIIGMPGDTIAFENNILYINGQIYTEPYLSEPPVYEDAEFTVPTGQYFCMGDNRNHSYDARFWKDPFISEAEIAAKTLVVWKI